MSPDGSTEGKTNHSFFCTDILIIKNLNLSTFGVMAYGHTVNEQRYRLYRTRVIYVLCGMNLSIAGVGRKTDRALFMMLYQAYTLYITC